MNLRALRALPATLALGLGLLACVPPAGDAELEDDDASDASAVQGGVLRGVKWKQEMGDQDRAKSARLETDGLGTHKAAKKLLASGVKDVVGAATSSICPTAPAAPPTSRRRSTS